MKKNKAPRYSQIHTVMELDFEWLFFPFKIFNYGINPLSVASFAIIFSQSEGCLGKIIKAFI